MVFVHIVTNFPLCNYWPRLFHVKKQYVYSWGCGTNCPAAGWHNYCLLMGVWIETQNIIHTVMFHIQLQRQVSQTFFLFVAMTWTKTSIRNIDVGTFIFNICPGKFRQLLWSVLWQGMQMHRTNQTLLNKVSVFAAVFAWLMYRPWGCLRCQECVLRALITTTSFAPWRGLIFRRKTHADQIVSLPVFF